jgi:glutamate racemase
VFDSGIGGLTVAAALRELMPSENIFYIGDTARVPYGGKSQQTIERYAIEITGLLLAERAKMIVVACNTASALAIPKLEQELKVPVIGVIEPGARAAARPRARGTSASSARGPPFIRGPTRPPSTPSIRRFGSPASPARCSCRSSRKGGSTIPSPTR